MNAVSRVALVTGASRRIGIGAAVCRALARQGVDVFFTYWRPYDGTMPWGADDNAPALLEAELHALGVRCASLEADLSQPDTPAAILDAAEAALDMVSILVNNATYSVNGGYDVLDAAMLDAHYAVNIRGTFLLSVEFARRFQAGSGGRIISLTSGQGLGPMPDELAYATTKGAVEAFTVSLATGVAHKGITVNAVDPGPTDTGWMSDDLKAWVLAHTPQGRVGTPDDAARLIAFLASDAAQWVTGQVIHSNGGFRP
ncbi:MAG: SDR family oxidoreductase [Chloroflexi bacterium]|nr:SDR family oxidoreductase [Chloroflexota bacterium]